MTDDDPVARVHDLVDKALQCLREAAETADQLAETDKISALKCYREIMDAAKEVQAIGAEQKLRSARECDLFIRSLGYVPRDR